ncbi:MAG: winged helix-turn-helix domain-containing protein [Pyrinomonadaceae bacterium]
MIYRFGQYIFDGFHLTRNKKRIDLEKKEREILRVLLEKAANDPFNKSVSLEELKQSVWDGNWVETHTVQGQVSKLRKKLGEARKDSLYIPRNDFRIDPKVEKLDTANATAPKIEDSENLTVGSNNSNGAAPETPPYPGPRPFQEEDTKYFFGRDDDIKNLCDLISDKQKRIIFLYSQSGAGKTSLLNTVFRKTLGDRYNVLPTARLIVPGSGNIPGQNPYTLAALTSMGENDFQNTGESVNWTQYLSEFNDKNNKDTIVVIDQAEELLTINFGEYQNKRNFFIEIGDALEKYPNLHFVIAFREEYLAELQRISKDISKFCVLSPMALLSLDDAKLAIIYPADHFDVKYDPDVLSRLITKLSCIRFIDYLGNLREEPTNSVAPLQLQLTCHSLWKVLEPRQRNIFMDDLIKATHKENFKGDDLHPDAIVNRFVESVLHEFCEAAVVDALSAVEGFSFSKELVFLGCYQFISEQKTRIAIYREDYGTGRLPNEIVEKLAAQQFLRVEYRHGKSLYELAHDTLIDPLLNCINKIDDETLWTIFTNTALEMTTIKVNSEEQMQAEALIQEFCLVFIGKDGSSLQASRELLERASNRLPLRFIDGFVQHGILRKTVSQTQEIFEIYHPRLAEAIYRKRFRGLSRLYGTRKLLETNLENQNDSDKKSDLWDDKSEKLLNDIKEIVGVENLSEKEAGFVLRASLATGNHLEYFVLQIKKIYPSTTSEILFDAARKSENLIIRRNSAYILGLLDIDKREEELFNLVLSDADESVRKHAAYSLANIENLNSWSPIFSQTGNINLRPRVYDALTWIHDTISDSKIKSFREESRMLSFWERLHLRGKILSSRFKSAKIKILIILIISLFTTTILTALPRAALATFGLTITQVSGIKQIESVNDENNLVLSIQLFKKLSNIVEGAFNGVAGAIVWSMFIGAPLLFWWYVGERKQPWQGKYTWLVGALGGLIGGTLNTIVLVLIYGEDTLSEIHWIPAKNSEMLEVITQTGVAFAMPIYGGLIGLGSGAAARRMLLWWGKHISDIESKSADPGLFEISKIICSKITYNSLWIFFPMFLSAVFVYLILFTMPHKSVTARQLIGESISLSFGGIGLLLGLFLGLYIIRRGLPSLDN